MVCFFWELLKFDEILTSCELKEGSIKTALIRVANRLIYPLSDYATVDWAPRTALCEIIDFEEKKLNDSRLYRLLDKLYPERENIERKLYDNELSIFNLEGSVFFIDFTSLYFEGTCYRNKKAKRGYSRDKRGDCKQLVLGAAVGKLQVKYLKGIHRTA